MTGDEVFQISEMMGSMERRLSDKIGDVSTQVAGTTGRLSAEVEAVRLRTGALEAENVREEWKNWLDRGVFGGAIVGVNFILHKVATTVGWKI